MRIELLSVTPFPEKIIEEAGRTCYMSKVGNPSIIKSWIKSGHCSVIEHASASFRISEVSRSLTHQLVRHRIGFSYSQKSQRYCKEDQFEYVIPEEIRKNKQALNNFHNAMIDAQTSYNLLILNGIKAESARSVLPNACCTEIVVTANFRAWRQMLELRCDKHAQKEIRDMSKEIGKQLLVIAPNVFDDLKNLINE